VTCAHCGAVVEADLGRARNRILADVVADPPPRRSTGPRVGLTIAAAAMVGAAAIVVLVSRTQGAPVVVPPRTVMATPGVVEPSIPPRAPATLLTFGEEGTAPGQFQDARTIAVDPDENIFVADYLTGRVQKFDPTGKFLWLAQVPKNPFSGDLTIFGLAVTPKNELCVARTGDLLFYASADGKYLRTVKGNYDRTWFHFVAIDPAGNLYSAHSAAGNVDLLRLNPEGKLEARFKGVSADAIAVDGLGNLFVVQRYPTAIVVLDPQGAVKLKFGGNQGSHVNGASAIAVDGKGRIFAQVSEGLDVFAADGAFLQTLQPTGQARALTVSAKGNLFLVTNAHQVLKLPALP
jgi:DNA-binding beta-propeller fold protein YncE